MSSKKLVLVVTLTLLIAAILPSAVLASQPEAATAISSAKSLILNCYYAARDAEAAGANITLLTSRLNDAGTLLSRAELAYTTNDFDAARDLADQSRTNLSTFISEANTLRETATQQRNLDFLVNVVGSVVGAFAVVGIGAAAWVFLKKKYETAGANAHESSRL